MSTETAMPAALESPWTEAAIERQRESLKLEQNRLLWLIEHEELLRTLPPASFFSDKLDFDHLSHADVMRVILAFPGHWNKELHQCGTTVNYTLSGDPPPSCKIVEVEEIVPAIPESVRTVRKMICSEPGEEGKVQA